MDEKTGSSPSSAPWPAQPVPLFGAASPARPARKGPSTVVVVAIVSLTCTTLLWLAVTVVALAAPSRTAVDAGALDAARAAADEYAAVQQGRVSAPAVDPLAVGDCLLLPSTPRARLMVVGCTDPHDGEVFAITAPVTGWEASSAEVRAQVTAEQCLRDFSAYTGQEYGDSTLEVVGAPWGANGVADQGPFVCIAADFSTGPTTTSVRSTSAATV